MSRRIVKYGSASIPLSQFQTPTYVISKSGSIFTATAAQGSGLANYSGTDGGVVMNSAITALATLGNGGGGMILIQAGITITGTAISITSIVTIFTEGYSTTQINAAVTVTTGGAFSTFWNCQFTGTVTLNYGYCEFHNCVFNGALSLISTSTPSSVNLVRFFGGEIRNSVTLSGNFTGTSVNGTLFDGVFFNNTTNQITLTRVGGSTVSATRFIACYFSPTANTIPILATWGDHLYIYGCHFENQAGIVPITVSSNWTKTIRFTDCSFLNTFTMASIAGALDVQFHNCDGFNPIGAVTNFVENTAHTANPFSGTTTPSAATTYTVQHSDMQLTVIIGVTGTTVTVNGNVTASLTSTIYVVELRIGDTFQVSQLTNVTFKAVFR
jgi:hypothetical protein